MVRDDHFRSQHPSTAATVRTRPWSRAVAFGATSASIGTFGHAYVMGDHAHPLLLVVAFVLLTAYARIFAGSRIGAPAMVAGLLVGQLAVHVTALVTTMPSMSMSHAAHAGTPMVIHHAHHPAIAAMLLVHAVAILLGAALLLQLERAVWNSVRAVATEVVGAVRQLVRVLLGGLDARPVFAAGLRPSAAVAPTCPTRSWVALVAGRRGPPLSSLA